MKQKDNIDWCKVDQHTINAIWEIVHDQADEIYGRPDDIIKQTMDNKEIRANFFREREIFIDRTYEFMYKLALKDSQSLMTKINDYSSEDVK